MPHHKKPLIAALSAAVALSACNNTSLPSASIPANVLYTANQIAYIDAANPGSLTTPASLSGIVPGDTLVSIDRRPVNGFLYGLGYNATNGTVQLYVIHPDTSTASAVGSPASFADSAGTAMKAGGGLSDTRFEMDFNPTVDRVRVISSRGENFRLNPNTGAAVDTNSNVAGNQMDGSLNIGGGAAQAQGTAYTNSAVNASATTQYTLDEVMDALYIQNPPNNGTLTASQNLSAIVDSVFGLDILPGVTTATSNTPVSSGEAFALIKRATDGTEALARIDLTNGGLAQVSPLATAGARGLALQNPASATLIALAADGTLIRSTLSAPGTVSTTTAISGLNPGELPVGIDFRPATGQLVLFAVNPGTDTGTLYVVDPQSAAATVIGTAGSIAFVDSTGGTVDLPDPAVAGYGFDFNPTVDRIRVTTGTGLNFRLNPVTGGAVDGDTTAAGTNPDGAINGSGVTGASGAAYTNSVAGTTVTTLYILDPASGQLSIQNPPNGGTQTMPLALRLNGAPVAIAAVNDFDIPANVRTTANNLPVTGGDGYAALKIGGVNKLFRINLVTGGLTDLGAIGTGSTDLRGLAIGITHAR